MGLFVVGVKNGNYILIKTLGEYGYVLPREFRNLPRKYYKDDNIDIGWEILEEMGEDADDDDFD